MSFKWSLTYACLILSSACFCQNQNNNWYFGTGGLNFNAGAPVPITTSGMSQYEGSASISSPQGELLFYTSGEDVFDKENYIMPNGTGLLGDYSSSNSAVIVPKPGDPNKYYIFTTEANLLLTGLHYTLVDMCANGGLGDVVPDQKNIFLIGKTPEKVTTALHENGIDIWVITHGWLNGEFYAFKVTSAGVEIDPIISEIGPTHGPDFYMSVGCMKTNRQNNKLALAVETSGNRIELYDFDNETGIVSNPVIIPTPHSAAGAGPGNTIYGIEFSPSGNLIYTGSWYDDNIYQLDISIWDEAVIAGSATIIGNTNACCVGALQSAPDGKIYAATQFKSSLGVINFPDIVGLGCNYVDGGIGLAGETVYAGLTAYCVTAQQIQPSYVPDILYTGNCLGSPTEFSYEVVSTYDSVEWHFGDSGSPDNISDDYNPSHTYSDSGNFIVSLIYHIGCFTDTAFTEITILYDAAEINLPSDTVVCYEDISTILLEIDDTYLTEILWSTGDTTNNIIVSETGIYSVTAESGCGTLLSDEIMVTFDTCNVIPVVPIECAFAVPNAFSPNGDGVNDVFNAQLSPECSPEYFSMLIYNRWGEMIFESGNFTDFWNGEYSGKQQEIGSYIYVIKYKFLNTSEQVITGNLVLIR